MFYTFFKYHWSSIFKLIGIHFRLKEPCAGVVGDILKCSEMFQNVNDKQ